MKALLSLLLLFSSAAYAQEIQDFQVSDTLTASTIVDADKGDISINSDVWTIDAGVIDETQLDASVNASLDLADTAIQTAHTTDTNLTQEEVEDFAGALIGDGTGTHTGIAVTYQDATGDVDIVVDHDAATNFDAGEHFTQAAISITESQVSDLNHTMEGTAVLSTGETDGKKYLREDGDGTSSWRRITQITNDFEPESTITGSGTGFNLQFGAGDALYLNGSAGTSGQFIKTNGAGSAPTFATVTSESTTASDTATIDLTLTGVDVSGIVVANSIGAAQLDAATDASLALADSASQINWANASAGTIHSTNYVDNDTTYSVGDGGLSEINFTTADNSKLDGIEASADITDTANVTSSGALMDSEVDADLKTFDLPASTTITATGASIINDASMADVRTTIGVDAAGTDNSTDVTLAGTGTYVTAVGQVLTVDPIDISTDTNLTGDAEIVLTGDALSIASTIARDTELHGNGTNCSAGNYPLGVDASGNAESCTSAAGGGDVLKVGTPVNDQIGIWTGDGTLEGDAGLTFDGTNKILTVENSGTTGKVTIESQLANGAIKIGNFTATPAADTKVGQILFQGYDDASVLNNYARIQAHVTDDTAGAETGYLSFLPSIGGSNTEALRIDGAGDVSIPNGDLSVTGDIVMPEKADHSGTPAAGKGYLWTKNTAPSSLMYTDDAGTDYNLSGESWNSPTLLNSWVNYGSGYDTTQYKKVGNTVYVKGMVKSGSAANATIFTLPSGYRPTGHRIFASVSANSGGVCRIDVTSDGNVYAASYGSTTWTAINVSFSL